MRHGKGEELSGETIAGGVCFLDELKSLHAMENFRLLNSYEDVGDPEAIALIGAMVQLDDVEIDLSYNEDKVGVMCFSFPDESMKRLCVSGCTSDFTDALHKVGVTVWGCSED